MEDPPEGDPPEGTRNTREEKLVRAGAERSWRQENQRFFSESLILAQNERW